MSGKDIKNGNEQNSDEQAADPSQGLQQDDRPDFPLMEGISDVCYICSSQDQGSNYNPKEDHI